MPNGEPHPEVNNPFCFTLNKYRIDSFFTGNALSSNSDSWPKSAPFPVRVMGRQTLEINMATRSILTTLTDMPGVLAVLVTMA